MIRFEHLDSEFRTRNSPVSNVNARYMLRNMNGAALKVVGGYDRVIEESELTVVPMGAREIGILILENG